MKKKIQKNNKNENDIDYAAYRQMVKWFHGFSQNIIVDICNEFFITKRNIDDLGYYEHFKYELWKFNSLTCEMEKVDLGEVNCLEFKNKFLVVYKTIVTDRPTYLDEIYELPSLNKIMTSNALGIDIKDTNDYYIVNELTEDNNGDLYTKRSRLIDKITKKEVSLPWEYYMKHHHKIRNAFKNSFGDVNAVLYDYHDRNGIIYGPKGRKKDFKKFCEYDDKLLIYDDLEHAKVVNYSGIIEKEIKINIKLRESEELFIDNFKNGFAKFTIENFSPSFGYFKHGILNFEGNIIISNCEYVYLFDNNKYIFEKEYRFYLSGFNNQNQNQNKIIGKYIPKTKNEYIISNDINTCFLLNNKGEIILTLPFLVSEFDIKDSFGVFKSGNINYLYNLTEKKEIINSFHNITIINDDNIIINDEIKKIENLNEKEKEEEIEKIVDSPKTKFLSRFSFKKKN